MGLMKFCCPVQFIDLTSNSLTGNIPALIAACVRVIDVTGNQLSYA